MTKMHKNLEVGISLLLIVVLMPGFKAMNECEIRGIRCPFGSECKNSAKSAHDCVCAKGFKLFEEKQKPKKCEDIDECLTGESSCSGSRCLNTEGSYQCIPCLPGFIENRYGDCVGVSKGGCNCDHKTENCKYGKCRCKKGHQRNKQGRCVSVKARGVQCPRSSLSFLFIGLLGCLALSTTATTPSA
ncbi:fibulin-1-like isoform X2 [Acropora muricata]|uniref:fibulin-1-like isoform X2 n=1 Tax=Acropora muricata TaxID=159855 RepID=UPI0034E5A1E6